MPDLADRNLLEDETTGGVDSGAASATPGGVSNIFSLRCAQYLNFRLGIRKCSE